MSEFGNSLPSRLREPMNDDKEICSFQAWFQENPAKAISTKPMRQPLYDKRKSEFVDTLVSPQLKEAIRRYQIVQANESKDSFWSNCDLEQCSWNQVFTELANAEKSYWENAKNNPARRFLRKGEGINRNLRPFLEGIPQDDGLGLIKGAFIIIFKAVQARSIARDKILQSFNTMPESILDAERLRQCYPEDQPLFSAIQSLHDELIKGIPSMIDILLRQGNDSKLKRLTKPIFGDPVAEVEKILKPVEVAEKNLERCRRDLNTKSIANTATEVAVIREDFGNGVSSVKQEISSLSVEVTAVGARAGQRLDSLHDKQDMMLAIQQDVIQALKKSDHDAQSASMTRMMNPLFTMMMEAQVRSSYPVIQYERRMASQRSIRENIMAVICTHNERISHAHDIGYIMQRHYDFGHKALSQAQYLLQTTEFRKWFTSPYSEMLLVDGHCNDQSIGRLAPTSLTCAGIARAMLILGEDPHTGAVSGPETPRLTLYFFIGQHLDQENGFYGPNGLIRSFIDQLLRQWPDEEHLDLEMPGNHLNAWTSDMAFLCSLFETLVCQLGPRFTVWCVVDGLSHFETRLRGWYDELLAIVDTFLFCKKRKSEFAGRGVIKILLVSPDCSIHIRNRVDSKDCVDLRAGNMYSGIVDHVDMIDDLYWQES